MTEDDVFAEVFMSPLEPEVDRGRIGTPEFLEKLRAQLALQGTDDEVVTAWCDMFEPNEHLIAQLPRLRQMAGRLVLASNTNDLHFQWIARQFAAPLAQFDALVLSYQVGLRKPEPAFFLRAAEAAGVPASACVFVDDKPQFVDAARAVSMHGVVYEPGLDLVTTLARYTC